MEWEGKGREGKGGRRERDALTENIETETIYSNGLERYTFEGDESAARPLKRKN